MHTHISKPKSDLPRYSIHVTVVSTWLFFSLPQIYSLLCFPPRYMNNFSDVIFGDETGLCWDMVYSLTWFNRHKGWYWVPNPGQTTWPGFKAFHESDHSMFADDARWKSLRETYGYSPLAFAPSQAPTIPAPSVGPTQEPTDGPTAEPTSKPSVEPTPEPTAKPMNGSPTVAPTPKPTKSPSSCGKGCEKDVEVDEPSADEGTIPSHSRRNHEETNVESDETSADSITRWR